MYDHNLSKDNLAYNTLLSAFSNPALTSPVNPWDTKTENGVYLPLLSKKPEHLQGCMHSDLHYLKKTACGNVNSLLWDCFFSGFCAVLLVTFSCWCIVFLKVIIYLWSSSGHYSTKCPVHINRSKVQNPQSWAGTRPKNEHTER